MDNTSTCTTVPPSFTGVSWTLEKSPATTYFTDLSGFGFEYLSPDDFGVVSDRLQVDDPDQELCWVSPTLNIAAAGAVSISVDVSQTGGLESGDFVKGEYSLNGGAFVQFGIQSGAFAATQLTVAGLSGTTLVIRICAMTNAGGEQIFIDNVSVPQAGVTTGCAAPAISTMVSQVGSCNPNSGAIKVTASAGTPGYNVAWSGPSSGNPAGTEIASSGGMYNITGLAAGTYTITVTDADNCSATTTASVTTAAALALSTQALNISCNGQADGEIDLSVSNGVPPYTFNWNNLPGSPDPEDQTGLLAGTYTVTVTDAAGCTATTSATVGVGIPGAYLETFSTAGKGILDGSTCSGADGTTCTNNNFAGVNWSIYGLANLTGIDATDYFKTTGGKLEAKDLDQIVCWESPLIDIDPPGSGVAFSIDLSWTGFDQEPGADHIDVEYSLDGGAWTLVPNQVGGGITGHTIVYANGAGNDLNGSTTVTVNGLSGSTLRIRVCGLINVDAEFFTIDNVSVPSSGGIACPCTPPLCTVTGPDYVCNNAAGNTYFAPPGMSAYSWSVSGAGSIPGSTTSQSVSVTSGNYLNTYTVSVTVTDANGCTSTCSKQSDIFLFTPPADITVNPNPACLGVTLDLSITAAASSTVFWTGEGITNPNGNPSTTAVPTTTGPHIYGVTVTTDYGCSNTGTASVQVNPTPQVNTVPNMTYCAGANVPSIVFTSDVPGATFAWSRTVPNPDIGLGPNAGTGNVPAFTANPNLTAPATATFSVVASYTSNGLTCTGTPKQFTVTINPVPQVNAVPNQTHCAGSNVPSVVFTSNVPGASFAWSRTVPNPDIGLGVNSGAGNVPAFTANPNLTAPATATFSVVASYTNNGVTCTGTPIQFSMTVNPKPQVNAVPNMTYCDGDNVPAVVFTSNVPGATFAWSRTVPNPDIGLGSTAGNGNVPAFSASNTGMAPTTSTFSVVASYTNNGVTCTGTPIQFMMTIAPDIPVDITFSPSYCMKDPGPVIGLSASLNGATYQLQDNGGNDIGVPRTGTGGPVTFGSYPNGTYKVTGTNGNCTGEATATVNSTAIACTVDVPKPCNTCNEADGYAPVTVKVGAPAGQNWTVKAVIGLYTAALPHTPIAVGTPLQYVGGNMYTLDAARSTTKGYWVQVTNGFTDLDIMVGNASW